MASNSSLTKKMFVYNVDLTGMAVQLVTAASARILRGLLQQYQKMWADFIRFQVGVGSSLSHKFTPVDVFSGISSPKSHFQTSRGHLYGCHKAPHIVCGLDTLPFQDEISRLFIKADTLIVFYLDFNIAFNILYRSYIMTSSLLG